MSYRCESADDLPPKLRAQLPEKEPPKPAAATPQKRRKTERQIQTESNDYADMLGVAWMEIRPVRIQRKNGETYYETPTAGCPGWPDVTYFKDGRVGFLEFKQPGKKPTVTQQYALENLGGYWADGLQQAKAFIDWIAGRSPMPDHDQTRKIVDPSTTQ